MSRYPNRDRALHQIDRHQAPSLQSLSDRELVEQRGTARFGGPTAEETTEAARRIAASLAVFREQAPLMIAELVRKASAATGALRAAGVLPAED